MKTKYLLYILLITLSISSCYTAPQANKRVSIIKYLEPGVNDLFAAHAISGNKYLLLGMEQTRDNDFGELKSTLITFEQDTLSVDSALHTGLTITQPSNIVVNDDNGLVFFALSESQELLAIHYDSEGQFQSTSYVGGFVGMSVIAAAKKENGYWLLVNDGIYTDNSSRTYIVSLDNQMQNSTIVDTINYHVDVFEQIIGKNIFNKYQLFAYLQEYCFIKNNGDKYYFNSPVSIGSGPNSTTAIGLVEVTENQNSTINVINTLTIPSSFVKEMDFSTDGMTYPIAFNYEYESIDFYTYDISSAVLTPLTIIPDINPYKKLLFAVNNTNLEQEKIVVATKYNNKILIYSPVNPDISFSFGGAYETEIKAAFWSGVKNDELIIFGNSKLYNQFASNFIIMLPKESIL
jgi:hypothetical protein